MAQISIASLSQTATSYTHELHGRKDPTVATVYVDGSASGVTYPTAETWKVAVQLAPGDNNFTVYGIDQSGTQTGTLTIAVTLPYKEVVQESQYNQFDDFGILMSIERLPGEKNIYLKHRIQDAALYPASSSYSGLISAWNRNLGIKVARDVFSIDINTDSYNRFLLPDLYITIGPYYLVLVSDNFRSSEFKQVDPFSLQIALDYYPVDLITGFRVETYEGNPVPDDDYEIDAYKQTLQFTRDYENTWVRVIYDYGEVISTDCTIAELKTSIEGYLDGEGRSYFTVTTQNIDTSLTAKGLTFISDVFAPVRLDYSHIRIIPFSDYRFKDSFLQDNHLYQTQMQKWARLVSQYASYTWGGAQLDVSLWDETAGQKALDYLPHIVDTRPEYWTDSLSTIYTFKKYFYSGGWDFTNWEALMKRSPGSFKSGIGFDHDLKVVEVIESDN